MREGMPPRARRIFIWRAALLAAMAVSGLAVMLGAGCSGVKSAREPSASQAAPPPPAAGSTAGASTTPAPATGASPVPEFGTLPPPPPPPDPHPAEGAVASGEGWVAPAPAAATTSGYRVQIFASSDRTKAEAAAAEARQKFTETVYVEFEAPLYKVRVGDCATRYEAETLKEKAGSQGYDGAWIAETQVGRR
jgi:rare lipoprotein A